jgi:nicotinate phosphoribosyltransferase
VKQVYRYVNDNHSFYADAILLDNEEVIDIMIHPFQPARHLELSNLKHEVLLTCAMHNGTSILPEQTPYQIAGYAGTRLAPLPEEHKRFDNPHVYKVGISRQLMGLRDELTKQHKHPVLVK